MKLPLYSLMGVTMLLVSLVGTGQQPSVAMLSANAQPITGSTENREEDPILLEVTGRLEDGDESFEDDTLYDVYSFDGQAGQTVGITLESIAFDTFLLLENESGERLATNDDIEAIEHTNNSWISITLPADGTYTVLANAYEPWARGEYQLTVREGQAEPQLGDRTLRQLDAHRMKSQGIEQYNVSQFRDALVSFENALDIYREVGDRVGESHALNNLGLTYHELGQYPQAIEHLEQRLAIARELGDREGEQFAFTNFGNVYYSLGQYSSAIEFYEQSLTITRERGDRRGEGKILGNLASVYFSQGKFQQDIDLSEQSLAIARELGDREGEGIVLTNLGNVYKSLGQYQRAIHFHQQSLEIFQELGHRVGEGTVSGNLGSTYLVLGQYQRAIELFEHHLSIAREIGDRAGEASALGGLGLAYKNLDQNQQAIEFHEQSLAIEREIGNLNGESRTLNNLGTVYYKLGDYQQAIILREQGLAIDREMGDRAGEGATLGNLGIVYRQIGDYSQALDYYQQALAIAQEISDREREGLWLQHIGALLQVQDQPELAIIFYKQAVNVRESIRNDIKGLSIEQQQSFTDTISASYRVLADLLLQQDRILEAQRILDLLKVQELDEYLDAVRGNATTASGIDYLKPEQEILERYQVELDNTIAIGQRLTQLNTKAQSEVLTPAEENERTQLVNLQRDLAGQFNSFANSDDINALLDQLDRKILRQTVGLEELSAQRDKLANLNAALVYPLILEDRIELIITTATTEPLRRTVDGIGREQLNEAIAHFRQALESPRSNAIPPAQTLYQWLIEPLEADLAAAGVDTLIYAPDGPLRYIPLGALHDGNQWLTQRFRINNITAQSLQELDALPQADPRLLAGAFADESVLHPVEGFHFRGLPFAGKEVERLIATLPQTTALMDDQFSLQQVLNRIGTVNILHFATHAAFVPGDPSDSFILFGNGDAPTLRDIETWSLSDIDLVVLSACETGLGGYDNNGEQILGLGYQFQSRGAKAVIASLWQVSDGGTQSLMDAFYSALSNGYSKTEAIQHAQQDLLTSNLSHPYYWAPFILIGNGL